MFHKRLYINLIFLLQIFGIIAFATCLSFSIQFTTDCQINPSPKTWEFDYPFKFYQDVCLTKSNTSYVVTADVSSDAQFFVATGVLSLLYSVFIIFAYAYLDELYQSKTEIPMADFMITTAVAVLWLSASAAWANGTSALKVVLNRERVELMCQHCLVSHSGFNGAHTSITIGFLNFFLWASDLWFVYKETLWFQSRQGPTQTAIA